MGTDERETPNLNFPTTEYSKRNRAAWKEQKGPKIGIGRGIQGLSTYQAKSSGKTLRGHSSGLGDRCGPLLFRVRVERRNPVERVARSLGFGLGEIFVMREVDRHSQHSANRRLHDTQDCSLASNMHTFAERDFGRHNKSDFHGFPLGEGKIGENEGPAGAEVLRKAGGFVLRAGQFQGNWHVKIKSLPAAALKTVRSRHGFLWAWQMDPGTGKPGQATQTLPQVEASWKQPFLRGVKVYVDLCG